MDKLNRKGFTLVELLAVIVILAIIIALVFPQVSSVMNSSKVSAVHSQSKTIVSSWAQMIVEDGMQPEENWQISSELKEEVYNSSNKDKWVCMGTIEGFAKTVGLSDVEYKMDGNVPVDYKVDENTCSAIKYTSDNELEVLLVAKEGGKNYTAGMVTYGFSTATGGNMAPKSE